MDFDELYSLLESNDDFVNQYLYNSYKIYPKDKTVDELWKIATGVEGYRNPRLVLC